MTEPATDCKAAELGDLMVCERCGLEWPAAAAALPCDPITYERMRARIIDETTRAEGSLDVVRGLGAIGDPLDARRRLSELNAVLTVFDRICASAELKAAIKGKKQ